jgi:hypothetical protein
MTQSFNFKTNRKESALVIVFPPGVKGLFNPEIHGLVRQVQGHLDGVFVTYALVTGGSPDLRDAFAASRFNGCDSAVVVPVDGGDVPWPEGDGFSGDRVLTTAPTYSEADAPLVVEAYQAALAEVHRAA